MRQVTTPSTVPGLTRVPDLTILVVTISGSLNFDSHIDRLYCRANQSFLVAHGLTASQRHDVLRATTLARMTYASPPGCKRRTDSNLTLMR